MSQSNTFKIGSLSIEIDPANGKPTLSPSQVKAVIRKHAGYSADETGKRIVNRIEAGNGEAVTVAQAVKQFLNWQRVNHSEAVQAFQTGILELATSLCNGKFHVDVQASGGSGRVSIVADYTGSLSSRMTDLQAITDLVARLNG